MAMPANCIGLLNCTTCLCSSASLEACGTITGPKSLLAVAAAAGKSANLLAFAGYNNDPSVSPAGYINIAAAGATCPVTLTGPAFNSLTVSNGGAAWLTGASPDSPSLGGSSYNITIGANAGAARVACVCYTPICGTLHSVYFCQLGGVTWKCVDVGTCTTVGCGTSTTACQCALLTVNPALTAGECYCICARYNGTYGNSAGSYAWLCITRAGASILSCCITTLCASSSLSFTVCAGQAIGFCAVAHKTSGGAAGGNISISCITSIVGSVCKGSGGSNVCIYTS